MAHLLRRRHRLAPLVAALVAATVVAAPVPPAAAVTSEFGTSVPTYLDDAGFFPANPTTFTVPASGTSGPASLYPSTIPINHGATVLDVNVYIWALTSTYPADLDVLLVGPGGQQALIMSDVGGLSDITENPIIFDDEAALTIGDGPILNTLYRPQNQGGEADTFPSPAPAPTGNSSLSVFDGTSAAGTWSLYVVDDQIGDTHTFAAGWGLDLDLATAPYPSVVHVGGLPPVNDVNVKLNGITADRLGDVNLLLVGPGGQQSYLMGEVGSSASIAGVYVTLDDEAAMPLPSAGPISNGSYRPTKYGGNTYFPAPAPAASGNSALSVFDGLDPDGDWSLYAYDDTSFYAARLDGWSLDFTWDDTASPSGTVAVNDGALTTGSRDVTVDLAASDPEGTGVAAVRLSNDGASFGPYQAYAPTVPWTLTEGDGQKRVYAQFKDGAGNESTIVSDSITLATTAPQATDTTGPRAARLTPRKNAADVKATGRVKVKASEALRKGSVSPKTVFLKEKGVAGTVPAKLTYRAATHTLVLAPRSPLDRHTTYVVTVKGVKDIAGNRWDQKPGRAGAQPLKYSFRTG